MSQGSSTTEKEAASVGQVDHEVASTLSHVSASNGKSVADLSNTIVDSEGDKKTSVTSTIEHSKFIGDAISVSRGPTVVNGEQAKQTASMAVARKKGSRSKEQRTRQ